jgi:LPXTG-motif cell wall-anchored protein
MKKTKVLYWILTGLMAAFMLMASIPDVLKLPEVVALFTHLGYPVYLLSFIGTAKILAVIAILFPRFPRLKEWAYAGLVFDLIGALYSHISVGDSFHDWIFAIIGLLLVSGSYFLYRKRQSYNVVGQWPHTAMNRATITASSD